MPRRFRRSRRLRRLLVVAGLTSALAAWRNRMLAANEALYPGLTGAPPK